MARLVSRLKVLRWFGILCFSLIASILHGSSTSTDISADGCTLFVGEGSRIRRVDLCENRALADFNTAALPDQQGAQQVRVLPDGGLLVANVSVIARLDSDGNLTGTYDLPDHDCWAGLALGSDKTSFWAWSSCTSDFVRFELTANSITANSRMFGGGSQFTSVGVQVNHGMELHCSTTTAPNYLQVVWGGSNVFFMDTMASVSCTGSTFNTITGTGTGTINGLAGGSVEFTFVDGGNPGVWKDTARIVVRNALGEIVAETSGRMVDGSHIARE